MKKKNLITLSVLTALLVSGCVPRTTPTNHQSMSAPSNAQLQQPLPQSIQKAQLWNSTSRTAVASAPTQKQAKVGSVSFGTASWYGEKYHGRPTAYGEKYDMNAKTAAHKTLPHNTMVQVTDMITNKSEVVRINDKGPFAKGRIIDLSKGTAKRLGFLHRGTTDVRLEVVGQAGANTRSQVQLPKGKGCVGPDCQAKISKAPNDVYSKPYNQFNTRSSESLTENIAQHKIITDESQYIAQTQQNALPYNSPSSNEVYMETYPDNKLMTMTTPSSQIAIQVGAFRNFAGATQYANRYSLLDQNHKVNIKKYIEGAQPLYKVQIEGFSSDMEARQFMHLHHLNSQGAFLVRR